MNAAIVNQQSTTGTTTEFPVSLWSSMQPQSPSEAVLPSDSLQRDVDSLRDQAVADHMPMVRFLARQLHARLPKHVELEDLVSAGTIGLIDAAAKFDGNRKVQFRSYAQIRIRGAILDSLRISDWSPRTLRRQGREIESAIRVLATRGVYSPTDGELAEELGLSLGQYQQLLSDLKGLEMGSLQLERNEETGDQEVNYIPGSPADDPLFRCLQGELRERLAAAVDTLPEKERLVLTLYYNEELTMREIAQVLGVVESRISQMHSSGILRLRSVIGEKKPSEGTGAARRLQSPASRAVSRGTIAARQVSKKELRAA